MTDKEVKPAAPPPGVDQRTVSTASHKAVEPEAPEAVGDNGDIEADPHTLSPKARGDNASLPKAKSAPGKRMKARRDAVKRAASDIAVPAYDNGRRESKVLPEPERVKGGGTKYGATVVASGFGGAGGASGINPPTARQAAGALSGRPYIRPLLEDAELPAGT